MELIIMGKTHKGWLIIFMMNIPQPLYELLYKKIDYIFTR